MKQPSQGLMGCRSRFFFIPQSNPNRHWIWFQSFLELLIEQEKPVDSWRWILDEDRERLDDSGFHFNLNFRGKRGKKNQVFLQGKDLICFQPAFLTFLWKSAPIKKPAPTSSRCVELQKSRNFSVDVP